MGPSKKLGGVWDSSGTVTTITDKIGQLLYYVPHMS